MAVFDTEYCADSVEFSPFEAELAVVSTYQLDSAEDSQGHRLRKGRVYLMEVEKTHGATEHTVKEIQRIETAAILDSKWFGFLFDLIIIFIFIFD